jgi:hypothetical protein
MTGRRQFAAPVPAASPVYRLHGTQAGAGEGQGRGMSCLRLHNIIHGQRAGAADAKGRMRSLFGFANMGLRAPCCGRIKSVATGSLPDRGAYDRR